jgi:hypothetical protein
MPKLSIINADGTWFKTAATDPKTNPTTDKAVFFQQESGLPDNQKYQAKKGQIYSYSAIDMDHKKYNGHYKVTFDPTVRGIATWYVFNQHVKP